MVSKSMRALLTGEQDIVLYCKAGDPKYDSMILRLELLLVLLRAGMQTKEGYERVADLN